MSNNTFEDLKFNLGGYGHFENAGKQFVIDNRNTPRHWHNYMWNDNYITFFSQVGFGESFSQDSMGRRIGTVVNRNLYLLDVDSNDWWTANGLPIHKPYEKYKCVHGIGYSEISLEYSQISTSYRIFVPENEHCEIWTVKIKNNRENACKLKAIPYFKTEFDGPYKPQGYNTAQGFYFDMASAVVGKGYGVFEEPVESELYVYLTGDKNITGYDSRKTAFIGVYGEDLSPESLLKGGCQNSDCIAEKLCFALEATIEIQSGEEFEGNFIIGTSKSIDEIKSIREKFFTLNAINNEFDIVTKRLNEQVDGVTIDTPDSNLNCLFNSWLKYQANMGSRWARVRHNGFRDITSDCECFGSVNPNLAWERLKRIMSFQYSNGYAPRTFVGGSILDHNFSDNTVWLTFAVYSILKEKGDMKILDEVVKFNDGTQASVYGHIKRSVDFLWNFRALHGLIKIWGGDWNDCLNKAGLEGKGVSVWLSIAWYRANRQFEEIARMKGEETDALLSAERGKEMQKIVDQYGWDGEYYITAYTDNDIKIGSKECVEGKLFLIPQLWAVLSGISLNNKEMIAIKKIDECLETDLGTLISWPAYTKSDPNIGGMTQKPPGIHENGGVYLHPMTWKIAVECMLKRNDKVEETLLKILPLSNKELQGRVEPYMMCNSYFPEIVGYRYGTQGQSWRTATGAWLLKAIVNFVFGLQPEMEGLKLNPCLPPSWRRCSIQKKFRGTIYNITYSQAKEGACNNIAEISVNGKGWNSEILPYSENECYNVDVVLK